MPEEQKQYTVQELEALGVIQKHDVSTINLGSQVAHGPQYNGLPSSGLLAGAGPRREMWHTVVRPKGLAAQLYAGVTNITNPQFDILTGVFGPTGTNPSNFCGNPPKAGLAKLCTHSAQFGKAMWATDQNVLNMVGGRVNAADQDRSLLNTLAQDNALVPDPLKAAGVDLNSTLGLQLFRLFINMERAMERVLFRGNRSTAAASTEVGFIQEFDGFDRLIKTGYQDAITAVVCPSTDSIVENWGSVDVTATVGGGSIVDMITSIAYGLRTNAEKMGMNPVSWILVMDPDLFYRLTMLWPCSYITNGCASTTSNVQTVDAPFQIQMRDDMRTGHYLWIDGEQWPVQLTNGMTITDVAAAKASTIYFIPVSAMGRQVTYLEGFDQGNSEIQEFIRQGADYRVFNGGLWAMTWQRTNFCLEQVYAMQPRLIMETPYLAARLDNVAYTLRRPSRDPFPTDSHYVNGGRTVNLQPTLTLV